MNVKNEIYFRLTSNVIIDFLKNYSKENRNIIFKESECSGYKSIRFSTEFLDKHFKPINKNIGYYKNGHFAYFEIKPGLTDWTLFLNVSKTDLPYEYSLKLKSISQHILSEDDNLVTLYKKDLASIDENAQAIILSLNDFLSKKIIKTQHNIFEIDNDLYIEGAINQIHSNIYERNQEAREKCIEYHGCTCKICGFNFETFYGRDFKGKIEVHHIIPLHEIKKEYVVDPIKDLIPVCPNCHMVLHSKNDGTYKVDEVIEMIKKEKGEKKYDYWGN